MSLRLFTFVMQYASDNRFWQILALSICIGVNANGCMWRVESSLYNNQMWLSACILHYAHTWALQGRWDVLRITTFRCVASFFDENMRKNLLFRSQRLWPLTSRPHVCSSVRLLLSIAVSIKLDVSTALLFREERTDTDRRTGYKWHPRESRNAPCIHLLLKHIIWNFAYWCFFLLFYRIVIVYCPSTDVFVKRSIGQNDTSSGRNCVSAICYFNIK